MIEELIAQGQYNEALAQLNDLNDENTRYLRLVCLIGLGKYKEAKIEGSNAKLQAKSTYYDVVSMYITALKELEEYDEAIDLLIEELSMPYIPYEYDSLFNTAYDEILLAKQEANYLSDQKESIMSIEEIGRILSSDTTNDDLLYMAIDQLQQLNIRLILPTITEYLRSNHHPFSKTLIMEILIEQQVDEEFEVSKNHSTYYFNPSVSPLVLDQPVYDGVIQYLSRVIEDDNPTLFNQCVEYLEYFLYNTYNKEYYEEDYNVIAAAIHYYVATLQYLDLELEEIENDYFCEKEIIEEQLLALKEIEC